MTNIRSVSLPDTLTDIGYYAFYGCTSLTEIKIPASVTSIGGQVFGGCKNLSKINLGDNLKTLSASAFNGCDKIDSVSVPSGVTNIYNIDECEKPVRVSEDNQTYSSVDGTLYDKNKTVLYKYNNSLTQKSFTVPDTVRTLAFMAFANSRLQRITLPEGLTTMEKGVFYCCEKLETITIPDSVTEISTFLFESCDSLDNVVVGSGISTLPRGTFYHCRSLKNISFRAKSVTLQEFVFGGCTSMTEFRITDNIKRISNIYGGSFSGCTSLSKVILDHHTELSAEMFSGCVSLSEFEFRYDNSGYVCRAGALYSKNGETLAFVFPSYKGEEYRVEDGVKTIGYDAFRLAKIKKVVIPDGVVKFNDGAFNESVVEEVLFEGEAPLETESLLIKNGRKIIFSYYCNYTSFKPLIKKFSSSQIIWNALDWQPTEAEKSGTLGNNLKWYFDTVHKTLRIIGKGAMADTGKAGSAPWYHLSTLTESICIDSDITNICAYAFYGFDRLTEVNIGKVRKIGADAFYGCEKLSTVLYEDDKERWISIEFASAASNPMFYADVLRLPKGTMKEYTVLPGVTAIGDYTFAYLNELEELTVESSLENISSMAFIGSNSLKKIVFTSDPPADPQQLQRALGTMEVTVSFPKDEAWIGFPFKSFPFVTWEGELPETGSGSETGPVTEPTTEPVTEPATEPLPDTETLTVAPDTESQNAGPEAEKVNDDGPFALTVAAIILATLAVISAAYAVITAIRRKK